MAGDQYWYSKILGLHCDGTNGSTTFTDVKGKTVTVVGNTQISTAQYPSLTGKSSSAIFDGSGDALTLANSTDFTFSGDFAIRCRVRFSGGLGSNITLYNDEGASGYGCLFQKNASDKIAFTYMPDNAADKTNGGNLVSIAGATSVTTGVWYTFEVSRSGTSCKVFLDGAEDGAGTISSGVGVFNPGGYKAIGGRHYVANQYFNGYLSEIEVYKGTPLNTATYTPSSDPFPDTYVRISGTTKDTNGSFVSRLVRVYRQDTGAFVGEQLSNGTTGAYEIEAANTGATVTKHFAVMHVDDANPPTTTDNALIYDDITPA